MDSIRISPCMLDNTILRHMVSETILTMVRGMAGMHRGGSLMVNETIFIVMDGMAGRHCRSSLQVE